MTEFFIAPKIHHLKALLLLSFCGAIALLISMALKQLIYIKAAALIIPIVTPIILALQLTPDAPKYIFSHKFRDIFMAYILILIIFILFTILVMNDNFGIKDYTISFAISISSFIGFEETSACISAVSGPAQSVAEYWCTQYFLSWFFGGLLFSLPSLALANKIVSRLHKQKFLASFWGVAAFYVISLVFIARYIFALDARHLLSALRPIYETIGQTAYFLTMMGMFTLFALIGTLLLSLTTLSAFKYLTISKPHHKK